MGKKLFSLCMALALCLGLLPVTALAEDAPANLYVGNIVCGSETSCWTTDSETGELTKYEDDGNNWNVKYDPSTATLTLKNATIKTTATYTYSQGAVIYAHSVVGSAVSLTINLEGTNTIVCDSALYGIYVNAEMSNESCGTDASLTITGNGSLDVSGSTHGIYVKSGTGDASLNINDASVVAKTTYYTSSGYAGVYVQSSMNATSSPQLSLKVNGGSLTASGGDGISFNVGSSGDIGATTSLTISDNAIVRAENGINAYRVDKPTLSGTGIVFDGTEGTVYGDVELQKDLEIKSGETLTIPEGSSLTVPEGKTLTNNGTINVEDGGNLNGGTTLTTPTISTQPTGQTVTEGNTASFTVEANGDNLSYQWQQSADNGQSWPDIDGATNDTYSIEATTISMSGYQYRCVVTGSGVSVISSAATLTVQAKPASVPVTGVKLDKTSLTLQETGSDTLTATVEPADATNKDVTWASSNSAVATVDATGNVKAVGAGTATITVTTEDGRFTATCTITVEKPYTPPPYIPPTYAVTVPDTTGGTVEVSPSRASSGRRVAITTQPAPGYELESLTVLDSRGSEIALTVQGDGKYTFTMPARKVTVQAAFAPVPLPFEDVAPGAWYEGAVRHAYFHNIMEGMSETEFSPTTALTRAMAAQILYNLERKPNISDENLGYPYEDVDAQAWYGDAVYWARITGVATGYGDGTFQPGDSITRQEFAQMLYNYAAYKGYDLSAKGDLTAFPDGSEVQEWALPAMVWANGNALINGHDDDTLEPDGTTTRAQAASILMRFDQNLVEE